MSPDDTLYSAPDWGNSVGGALERVQIFIIAESLKIEFVLSREYNNNLVQSFCETCVYFDVAHSAGLRINLSTLTVC